MDFFRRDSMYDYDYDYDEENDILIVDVPGFYKDEIDISIQEDKYLTIKCKNDKKVKECKFYVKYTIDNVKLINGQLLIKFKKVEKSIEIE